MIDQATQQKIKDTADIVEVVSDYVHLVRSGGNYKGLCPFHNERTPSFSVNKARNFCFCFSCKKGGSPVNFIMQKEGISYYEALRQLAKKYGIKIEEKEITDEERAVLERKEAMYLANEWAMNLFEKNLPDTSDGRDIGLQYLFSRGITEEAVKAFHLGYALDKGSAFIDEARKKGFNLDLLKELGLIGISQQGHEYDRFRGRVIFPIMSSSNKVVGFGGRTLKQDAAKYVNSPESDIYKKSNELYGISQARQAIVAQEHCFLVEGYLDVIGLWQSGVRNVVASSGTALTNEQVALIHRFAKDVTLIYDGDMPGIKAALRGMNMLLDHNLNVNVLLLPDGDDPHSFSLKHTPEELKEYIDKNTTDIIRFKAKVLMENCEHDPQKRFAAVRSIVETLAHIPDKLKRDIYIQECSRIMNVSVETISGSVADAYATLLVQKKKEREMRRLNSDLSSGRIPPAPSARIISNAAVSASVNTSPTSVNTPPSKGTINTVSSNNTITPVETPLRPVEWTVLRYCLRYGFLNFCEEVTNDEENLSNEKRFLTVVEYVKEELITDNVTFSVPQFAMVFDHLMDLLPQFRTELEEFRHRLEPMIEEKRREGYDVIAGKDLSIPEIKREERLLEESIEKFAFDEVQQFSRTYPSRMLASHENDIIRTLTNEAILDIHQLSHIYSRERPIETEEDKLINLLPQAITVWKNGILDLQFKQLLKELQTVSSSNNTEEERKIQARLVELMKLRSELAKDIGDRILCASPRIRK